MHELYTGYGFDMVEGSKHRLYIHPRHTDLRATVTRGTKMPIGYVVTAIRLVDALLRRAG